MIKDSRNFLWITPLALLLAFPVWKPLAVDFLNPAREGYGRPESSLSSPRARVSSEMEGVQLEQRKKGRREWFLTAGHLSSTENDAHMEMEDVQALFFNKDGIEEKTRIRSQKAEYNRDENRLILHGDVLVRDQQGYEMRTESLEYAEADKKIRTTSEVLITGNGIEVSAKRLLYDLATGDYSLSGSVVSRIW